MLKWMRTLTLALLCLNALSASAGDLGSADEAMAMVKKAVSYLEQHGQEQTLAELAKPTGQFVDRDLYVVVHDMNGVVLANSQLPRMVGKDISALQDVDGKAFIKERLQMLNKSSNGWIDFKWPNSVTQKIDTRSAYFMRVNKLVFTCGILKKKS